MADQRFLNSHIVPSATYILGYKLKPFCLKHRIWLEAIKSPFMEADVEISAEALIVALKICAEQEISKPSIHDRISWFRLSFTKSTMALTARAFINHISTSGDWPKFYERSDKSSGDSGTVPWQLSIIANLCKHGISYSDAMQMPEPKAIWLSAAFSIQDGAKLSILSTDDETLIDSLANIEEPPTRK